MNSTFGAPALARNGSGQAGSDTSNVRPMTPLKAVPGLYSLRAIKFSPFQKFVIWNMEKSAKVQK
jgi:hypothetical protein